MERRIKKGGNAASIINCPPDKSITHRAIMLGGFFGGNSIKNPLLGEDCISTADCLKRLGASVDIFNDYIKVGAIKRSNSSDNVVLDTGNSGTTTRLIAGLLSGTAGTFTISGDKSLNSRPMQRIITPLSLMGANIESTDGKAPLTIIGGSLVGINYEMPVLSAQVKSAILLASAASKNETRVTEKYESRNHTELMLKEFGANIETIKENGKSTAIIKPSLIRARDIEVVGDISSAAYPLIYSLILNRPLTVKNVGINKTRTGLLDVFISMGINVQLDNVRGGEEPCADITVTRGDKIKPFNIGGEIMPRLIDEIPALCVLAAFCEGESRVNNGEELKVKESNRQKTTVELINTLGGNARETEDGLVVLGSGSLVGGIVDSHLDHRIAMSAAIAAVGCEKEVTIVSPDCANVSFPGFYKLLDL